MGSHDSQFLTQFNSYFMLSRIRIGICIQIQANDCKSILSVKRDRRFVAGLRFQNDHPGFSGYRFSLHRFHKLGSDSAIAFRMIKHTDIADPKSIVPALHGALNVSDQFFSLKRAERKGILQPLAKTHPQKIFQPASRMLYTASENRFRMRKYHNSRLSYIER